MDARSLYDSIGGAGGTDRRLSGPGNVTRACPRQNCVPLYATYDPEAAARPGTTMYGIKVASSLSDVAQVWAIRSAVFISEQECPYHEEFDENDLTTHLIGYRGREPIATCRIRWWAEFAKLERLAVRHEYRNSRMSFNIVWAAVQLIRKKGYRKVVGQSQDRLLNWWRHFGFRPVPNRSLVFSDFSYTEIVLDLEPDAEAITIDTDPYVMIRPEGQWHKPGVLEDSAQRPVTSPLRQPSNAAA